ncbi:MAG: SCP2 sterol-binding domain-containing protein [Bacillota bacterium]|jgi:putative sterol carrier protein
MAELKDILIELQNKFNADPAGVGGLNATYLFDLTGDQAAQFHVVFANGKAVVNDGGADDANITVIMDADDFKAVAGGQLNAMAAFMSGKLKVQGDIMLAMKLQSLLG